MHLSYKTHLDDYHGNVDAHGVRSEQQAFDMIQDEARNGYDVSNITLDGVQVCRHLTPRSARCSTCEAGVAYAKASREHRYQGD